MPLQGPYLRGLIPTRMSLTEQGKQRCALQSWITFELRDHPAPIFLKRILARIPVVRMFELGRELACVLVFARRAFTHAGAGSSHSLPRPFLTLLLVASHLGILLQ